MSDSELQAKLLRAEQLGVRLEIVAGLPIWEASPVYKHQKAVDRIRETIKAGRACAYVHVADVYINFPDGSLKRPDVSIFRREPDEEEEAIKLISEAVIEVVSRGYEMKDTEVAQKFYLSQRVKDIIVFNPYTNEAIHTKTNETRKLSSPVEIEMMCGCRCEV